MRRSTIPYLFLSLHFSLMLAVTAAKAQQVSFDNSDIDPAMAEWIETMDTAVMNRWKKMTDWQSDSSWINEQVNIGLTGTLYNSGWMGANVKRNVLPDSKSGWLVIDTLTIPMGVGLRISSFMTNLFFLEQFPFVQVGAVKERTFVDVRNRSTYKDALLAKPFSLKKLPLSAARMEMLEIGETISTTDDGGFELQGGVGLSTLLGLEFLPDSPVDIGLSGKYYFKKSRQIDITRDTESTAMLLMRDTRENAGGAGIGLSISLERIPGPALFGIGSGNAYIPIKLNYSKSKGHVSAELFSFRLNQEDGRKAFDGIVKRDFTPTSEALQNGSTGVTRELLKQGEYGKTEKNAGINLLIFRSGRRSIYSYSDFVSTLPDGKSYAIGTRSIEKISEKGSALNAERTSRRYELILPLNPEAQGSFVLDYVYRFADRKTGGRELEELLTELEEFLAPRVVFPEVAIDRSYGDIRAELTVRLTKKAVNQIFNDEFSESKLWSAIAAALGVTDPVQWESAEGRSAWATKQGSEGRITADLSKKVFAEFVGVRNEIDSKKKLSALIHCDRDLKKKNLCLRTMLRLSDDHGVAIRGFVQGEQLGFGNGGNP